MAADASWQEGEHLPGKAQGPWRLADALSRIWRGVEADVEAAGGEYQRLQYAGAFRDVDWSAGIAVPRSCWHRGAAIARTELRAMTLAQLALLAALVHRVFQTMRYHDVAGELVTWDTANMYSITSHIVMPLTKRFMCSFVELIAEGEQRPMWFVSHWWGTPFKQTIALLTWQAKCRRLPTSATYWICTFANNQHELGELAGDLMDTPFVRAIQDGACMGTVALFDRDATTFSRVWCVLEGHFSTIEVKRLKPNFLYDLAGMLVRGSRGACLRLDHGGGDAEDCCEFNTVFPGIISKAAVGIRVQTASASREVDRRRILHYIAGTPLSEWSQEPPREHPKYDELNRAMRRGFAGQALIRSVKQADTEAVRSILDEFPEAVHFVSKRLGSVRDLARRSSTDRGAAAILEAALAQGGR